MGPRNVPFDTARDSKSELADACICTKSGDLLKSRMRIQSPFNSSSLVKALWSIVESDENAKQRTKTAAEQLELPLNMASFLAVHKYEVVVGGQVCTMRMVMKQYMEKERVVQVWSALSHWPLVGDIRNVQTLEQGWSFIQPVECDTSVCLSYIVLNPVVEGYVVDQSCNEKLESLAKLYQEMIISRLHTLESQTLDQVARKKSDADMLTQMCF
ncbi:hypothetical protein GN244_ATG12209 [Phytophthora infestans]|uniref:Uncharacterized protein n=1 Tax=Phytophthora infestans TaxID=4787 RepID=A0A833WSR4_PHYIN|nr:hypothetical protein GN244_ATG12209 [Phytophthora infestans]